MEPETKKKFVISIMFLLIFVTGVSLLVFAEGYWNLAGAVIFITSLILVTIFNIGRLELSDKTEQKYLKSLEKISKIILWIAVLLLIFAGGLLIYGVLTGEINPSESGFISKISFYALLILIFIIAVGLFIMLTRYPDLLKNRIGRKPTPLEGKGDRISMIFSLAFFFFIFLSGIGLLKSNPISGITIMAIAVVFTISQFIMKNKKKIQEGYRKRK